MPQLRLFLDEKSNEVVETFAFLKRLTKEKAAEEIIAAFGNLHLEEMKREFLK